MTEDEMEIKLEHGDGKIKESFLPRHSSESGVLEADNTCIC